MKVSSFLSLGYIAVLIPKLGRILKFKPQQCYKLIKTLLQTENEGRLGFELWPRFADFARFFCAFALNYYYHGVENACERVNLTFLMICVKVERHFSANHTFSSDYQTNFYIIRSLY